VTQPVRAMGYNPATKYHIGVGLVTQTDRTTASRLDIEEAQPRQSACARETWPQNRFHHGRRLGRSRVAVDLMSHEPILRDSDSMSVCLMPHSHTVATRQPSCLRSASFRRSRATFSLNFCCQNLRFDDGVAARMQAGCRCQKQPCTKTTARYLGNTKSGLPGRSFTFSLYLNPARCIAALRTRSGSVSRPRIPAIIRDRVAASTMSAISFSPSSCRRAFWN